MADWRRLGRGLLLIALLVGVAWVARSGLFGALPDKAWIDAEIRGQGLAGNLLFVAAGALFASVGLPRQAVAFLGGYGYGLLIGTGLATAAVVLGCMLSFGYGRLAGRGLGGVRVPARIAGVAAFLHDNTFGATVLVRLLPAGSNLLVNLAAGLSGVRAGPFFAGSALGYVPQMLIFALIGSGVRVDPGLRIGIGVLLFLVSGVLGLHLYRRYRGGLQAERSA